MNLSQLTVAELMERLGAKTPVPGGGAAASITAALAASLARMVVNYSIGRKSLAQYADQHAQALAELQRMETLALKLAEEDAAAYANLNSLWKLDKEDPRRQREWDAAVSAAIDAPMRVMQVCLDLAYLQIRLIHGINPLLASDWAIACVLADAAAASALWNIRVNLPLMGDRNSSQRLEADAEALRSQVDARRREVEEACRRGAAAG